MIAVYSVPAAKVQVQRQGLLVRQAVGPLVRTQPVAAAAALKGSLDPGRYLVLPASLPSVRELLTLSCFPVQRCAPQAFSVRAQISRGQSACESTS